MWHVWGRSDVLTGFGGQSELKDHLLELGADDRTY